MTIYRPFNCDDFFKYNNINLDPLTENYGIPFYLSYISQWPEYFRMAESASGKLVGYIMGKSESTRGVDEWHGHVTAVTVSPDYRKLGIGASLIQFLEDVSERKKCYFVDLYVRASNAIAVALYEKLGYVVYRRVLGYYSNPGQPDEDGLDMRKSLFRDKEKKFMIPLAQPVSADEVT